ncbi:MAG: hypothetical protein ACLU9X_04605 [Alistipes shahii]
MEEYRLQQLRYTGKVPQQAFSPSEEDKRRAVHFLSEKNLSGSLTEQLNTIGILGEDRNALYPVLGVGVAQVGQSLFGFVSGKIGYRQKLYPAKALGVYARRLVLVPQPYIGKRPVLLRQRGY